MILPTITSYLLRSGTCRIQDEYLLGNFYELVLQFAKRLVEIARKENAVAICHGATGKVTTRSVLNLVSQHLLGYQDYRSLRMTDLWTMQSREDEIDYCKAHGIDLPFDAKHSYSRDRNLWHISHEGPGT